MSRASKIVLAVMLLMLAAITAGLWFGCARADPVQYVPANYNEYGVPDGPCQVDPVICYPRMFYWQGAARHTLNLTGVFFAFWSPPMVNPWIPRAHLSFSVNYWGYTAGPPAPGDTMTAGGFQDVRRSFMTGVTTDSLTYLVAGKAWIDRAPSDSVYEGRATIQMHNPTWPKDWADTTYFRLVHGAYRR